MIYYLALLIPFLFILSVCAQSDATPKGLTGFELNLGKVFLEGTDPNVAYLGFSVKGKVDIGLGYAYCLLFNRTITPTAAGQGYYSFYI